MPLYRNSIVPPPPILSYIFFFRPITLSPSPYNPKDGYFRTEVINESISSKRKRKQRGGGEARARFSATVRRGTSKRMTSGTETHGHRNNTGRNEEKETSRVAQSNLHTSRLVSAFFLLLLLFSLPSSRFISRVRPKKGGSLFTMTNYRLIIR